MMPELGKYTVTVLSAYGVTLFLLVVLVVSTLRRGQATRAALRQIEEETAQNGKN